MSDISYQIDMGPYTCVVVSDGYIAVPISVPDGPGSTGNEPAFEKMDLSCMVIKSDTRNILVDTGCGSSFHETSGKLVENLVNSGIQPEDIDTIIYTHGHEDHVAGTFDDSGNTVFANARYIVSRKEWESWEAKPKTELNEGLFASARKKLLGMKDKFELVEDNYEVLPGIKLLTTRGHTLGGVVVEIDTGKQKLLCIGDLIHSETEFTQPDRYSFLDADTEAAITLRTEGLTEMAESGALFFVCHFHFPGIGKIVKKNEILGWEPVSLI